MKRMILIAVALCALLLTTAGAGIVTAKQTGPGSLPGRVYHYEVTYNDNVVGTLIINTNSWTYVFNAKGLAPTKTFYLMSETNTLGMAKATKAGTLHMQGAWDPNSVDLLGASSAAFRLEDSPVAQAGLTYELVWYYNYQLLPDDTVGLFVEGYSVTRDPATGTTTPVHVQGLVTVSYYDAQAAAWKPFGTVHTGSYGSYDFTTSFDILPSYQIDAKTPFKAAMQPDNLDIPPYWAYGIP